LRSAKLQIKAASFDFAQDEDELWMARKFDLILSEVEGRAMLIQSVGDSD
jgi:hypothetical protein